MTLNNVKLRHGERLSTQCRVRRPIRKTATNGTKYLSFVIEDCSRSLKAYAWQEHCDISSSVHDLDKVLVSGKIREFNNEWLVSVTSIQHSKDDSENALQLIPHSMCPLPSLLERLQAIVDQIANDSLRNFVGKVFSDDIFALPFINLPASRKHHHAMAGGLLEHSLECAEMVCRFSEFRQDMLDLAVVGALFHDAGKIITLRNADKFTLAGCVLDHDALTLEILSPYLKQLDVDNQDTAIALRYLWTWRYHRRGNIHPILTVAEAISAADRISSALNVEEEAFRESQDWQRFVRHGTNSSRFWRPRIEQQQFEILRSCDPVYTKIK